MNSKSNLFDFLLSSLIIVMLFLSLQHYVFSLFWTPLNLGVAVLFLLAIVGMELTKKKLYFINSRILFNVRVILLFGVLFPVIILIRDLNDGLFLLGFTIALIAASDIGALFGGKFFGKHKLSQISPNKTYEGSFFGVLAAILMAVIFSYFNDLNIFLYSVVAIFISITSQFGDLHESLTKRYFKVKDSSHLLPGHGGFYDRADSIIFVVPLIYLIFA